MMEMGRADVYWKGQKLARVEYELDGETDAGENDVVKGVWLGQSEESWREGTVIVLDGDNSVFDPNVIRELELRGDEGSVGFYVTQVLGEGKYAVKVRDSAP